MLIIGLFETECKKKVSAGSLPVYSNNFLSDGQKKLCYTLVL